MLNVSVAWQLMTPTLGGTIDSTFFQEYDQTVQAALDSGSGVYVIVDLVRNFSSGHACQELNAFIS